MRPPPSRGAALWPTRARERSGLIPCQQARGDVAARAAETAACLARNEGRQDGCGGASAARDGRGAIRADEAVRRSWGHGDCGRAASDVIIWQCGKFLRMCVFGGDVKFGAGGKFKFCWNEVT